MFCGRSSLMIPKCERDHNRRGRDGRQQKRLQNVIPEDVWYQINNLENLRGLICDIESSF
jgi:hypothetical protein